MSLLYRPLHPQDAPEIAGFPQSAEELFHMFPKAVWPFTAAQVLTAAQARWDATVVEWAGRPCGYANFALYEPGEYCTIGNVVVAPWARRRGVARFLINTMLEKAFAGREVPVCRVAAHATNHAALLLYPSLGFVPVAIEAVPGWCGGEVPLIQFRLERP